MTIEQTLVKLRDDFKEWVTTNLKTKSDNDHTHKYAGSSSVGGSATSAEKLNSNAGSETKPIYFKNGKPAECKYTVNKDVPSDAVFEDTHYTTGLKVGASASAKVNGAATNGNVHMNVLDDTTVRDSHKFTGTGATTVTSDASGNIIVDTSTIATTSANGLMSASDKAAVNKIGSSNISDIGDGTITGAIDSLNDTVNDCFQSVSDGKALLASAITDKGIDTPSDATFAEMAENIANIIAGGGSSFGSGNYSLAAYNSYSGTFTTGAYVNNFTLVDSLFFTFNTSNCRLTCNKAGTYILFADGYFASYTAEIYNSSGTRKASYYLVNQRFNEITLSVGDYLTFVMNADLAGGAHAQIGIYTKYTSGITGTNSETGKYSLGVINNYTGEFKNGTQFNSFTLVDNLIFSNKSGKLTCKTSGNYVIFGDGYWCGVTASVYDMMGALKYSFTLATQRFNEVELLKDDYITFTINTDYEGTGHHVIFGVYGAFTGELNNMITGDIVSGGIVNGSGIRLISKSCSYGPSDSGSAVVSGNVITTAMSDFYQASRILESWWEFSGVLVVGRGQIISITNTYRNEQKDDKGVDFHNAVDLYLINIATGSGIRLGSIMANGTTKSFTVPNDGASYAVRIYNVTGAGMSYSTNTAYLTISTLSLSMTDPTAVASKALVMLNNINGATAASGALMPATYFDKNYFINTNNVYQCRVSSTYTFFVAGDIYGNPKLVYLDKYDTVLAQFFLNDYKATTFEIGIPSGNRIYITYTAGSSSINKMVFGIYTSVDDPYLALEVTSMEPTEADYGEATSVAFTTENLVYMNDFAVTVGDTEATVTSQDDNSFTATIPATLSVGNHDVIVTNNGVETTAGSFTINNTITYLTFSGYNVEGGSGNGHTTSDTYLANNWTKTGFHTNIPYWQNRTGATVRVYYKMSVSVYDSSYETSSTFYVMSRDQWDEDCLYPYATKITCEAGQSKESYIDIPHGYVIGLYVCNGSRCTCSVWTQ